MEGLPGETVNLTAKITDGIGIDYIMLESMDWEFSNRIDFSDQNYIREYDLSESIVIPDQVARGDIGEVFIRVFDHAGRDAEQMVEVVVTPEPARLSIVQEMGFSIIIPGLKASVSGNDVTFAPVVGHSYQSN